MILAGTELPRNACSIPNHPPNTKTSRPVKDLIVPAPPVQRAKCTSVLIQVLCMQVSVRGRGTSPTTSETIPFYPEHARIHLYMRVFTFPGYIVVIRVNINVGETWIYRDTNHAEGCVRIIQAAA